MSEVENSNIGLIGLAVMGQNLALNIADHGFKISVYNRTYEKTSKFLENNANVENLSGCKELKDFVVSLQNQEKSSLWCKREKLQMQ
jgi:6-phosphogluconate dehydrogenase